jgi:hypothetical protein
LIGKTLEKSRLQDRLANKLLIAKWVAGEPASNLAGRIMHLDVKDSFPREQPQYQLVKLVDRVIEQAWRSLLLE